METGRGEGLVWEDNGSPKHIETGKSCLLYVTRDLASEYVHQVTTAEGCALGASSVRSGALRAFLFAILIIN